MTASALVSVTVKVATPLALVVADAGEMTDEPDPAATVTVEPTMGVQVPGQDPPWRRVTVTVVPPVPLETVGVGEVATTVDKLPSLTGWNVTAAVWATATWGEAVVSVAV